MGFLKDVFSNFFAMIFTLIGFGCILLSFIAFACSGLGNYNPLAGFLIFLIPGLIFLAIARAFAKRG